MSHEPNAAEIEQVWALLREHVPEVTSGVVKVVGISREPGSRTLMAVGSKEPRCDPVGAVVGNKGERVKELVTKLGGEKVDIVRWDESAEGFIANLLAPLRVSEASFDEASREAKVRVMCPPGSREPELGLRSKLLMDLTGWKLHVEVKNED